MKKTVLSIAIALTAMLVQAKNHTIMVRTDHAMPKGSTEVEVDQTGSGDIITITPANDVTTITVTVKDEYGEVIAESDVSTTTEGIYEVTTPKTTNRGSIEISDDHGIVDWDFE